MSKLITALAALTALYLFGCTASSEEPAAFITKDNPLIIHEWGTFTALMNVDGKQIAGVTEDAEPVPSFVYHEGRSNRRFNNASLMRSTRGFSKLPSQSFHPGVTMRLETPVLYVHLPDGVKEAWFDVHVQYNSGWLTEYYPWAVSNLPHFNPLATGTLNHETTSGLWWLDVHAQGRDNSMDIGPQTDEEVWLAPRRVTAARLSMPNGEQERYLFYRGVGATPSPVLATWAESDLTWSVHLADSTPLPAWLVDVRQSDGAIAYRPVDLHDQTTTLATFGEQDYQPNNQSIRATMHQALVADGLFADEAWAMLDTWNASYFQQPGLRLFYLLPQTWTDRVMPLHISLNHVASRTMVGRLEITTPRQEAIMAKRAQEKDWPKKNKLAQQLGRFPSALISDYNKRHPQPKDAELMQNLSTITRETK